MILAFFFLSERQASDGFHMLPINAGIILQPVTPTGFSVSE
jgi:hypothetical protein